MARPWKRTSGWRLGALALALAGIVGLTACGDDGGGSGTSAATSTTSGEGEVSTSFKMSFANITNKGPLQVGIRDSITSAAKTLGVELKLYDNNASDETAITNGQLMINDRPDVIADFNLSAAVNRTLGAQFNRAGIPCIAVNIPMPGCPWFRLDNAALGRATGEVVGDIAADRRIAGADTTVIILSAWLAGADVNQCVTEFYGAIADRLDGMQQIAPDEIDAQTAKIGDNLVQVDTDLLPDTAYQKVKAVLPSIPESRNLIVYGVNDDVVSGALRAIEDAGRTDKTLAAGLGGAGAIKTLRSNPVWVAEGDIFFNNWGEYILAMATALVNGVDVPEITLVPTAVLTKDNVDEFYAPGETRPKALPPVVPENEYLVPLGVLQQFGNVKGLS